MGAAEAFGGSTKDLFNHAVEIIGHITVPEAHERPSPGSEIGRPYLVISFRLKMLRAIKLDRQLCRATSQIEDVGTDDELACVTWTIARDTMPDFAFGFGLIVTQITSTSGHMIRDAAHGGMVASRALRGYPPPTPP